MARVLDLFAEQPEQDEEWEEVAQPIVDLPQTAILEGGSAGADFESRIENRLKKLEQLVSTEMVAIKANSSEVPMKRASDTREKRREVINITSSSSDSDLDADLRVSSRSNRREGRAKCKTPAFPQDEFLQDGEVMSSLNTVVLAGIRQVRHLIGGHQEVGPVLKHLEFLLKKSTLGVYRHEAYISYDRAVRARAERDGIGAFGYMATEELATSFCPENLVAPRNRDGKSKLQGGGKSAKPTKVCRAYKDGSCSFKNCIFAHSCLACDEAGHGKCDCPRLRPRNGNK